MKISVVIVSWNAKAFLLKCIDSIISQRGADSLEIVVVDNASKDGSPEAVKANYPQVKLIANDDNYGFAKANNIGIRVTTGDYLFLINSDVVVSEGCFAKTMRYMDEHPEIGMLGPKIVGQDGNVQRSCMGYPSLWSVLCRALALDSLFPRSKLFGSHLLTYWDHNDTRPVEVINGCFWVVRRTAMEQVGLLDERFFIYAEDIDWSKRFNEGGWQVVFFSEAEALHYGGASSSNAPIRFDIEAQRASYQYWQKHHSRVTVLCFLLISLLHHSLRIIGGLATYPLQQRKSASIYKIKRAVASIRWIVGPATSHPEKARG
jgi:GT2 family glycosyltransferase